MILLLASALAGPRFEGTLGVKTTPAGLGLLGTAWWDVGETTDLGPGGAIYFYWYELGLHARTTQLGGFFVGTLQAVAEPGVFKRAAAPDDPRDFMFRPLVRGRGEFNVRDDAVWLYSRTTGWSRHRAWAEYDTFQDRTFPMGLEASLEQSVALMGSPSGAAERKVWIYAETTLETSVRVGWLNRMVRGGVIVEKLSPSVSIDLDVSYSFM
ncbi:MAG: hypothetical protein H6734_26715, partial [Alphaproteobacteria bacterium]|nr:hypothetical protein [Alphaproteobacteria bacterium]